MKIYCKEQTNHTDLVFKLLLCFLNLLLFSFSLSMQRDCLKTQILSSGINCLKERFSESLTQNKTLIKCLTETWRSFFRGILPTLDEIFFRVKVCVLCIQSE